MIILVLVLILAGSAVGATILALQGAPWWQIALGYVAGGWGGLLAGLPAALLLRALAKRRRPRHRKGASGDKAVSGPVPAGPAPRPERGRGRLSESRPR